MSDLRFHLFNEGSPTKKLLRFGTDAPQCGGCPSTDTRTLCRVKQLGKADLILCSSCSAKRKPPSAKATARKLKRFEDAGYYEVLCVICSDSNVQVLELDHMANKINSGLSEPLCANHHAIKSHMAESGPMALLRLRDPDRTALALEAVFNFGLAAILGMMAASDGTENASRAGFFAIVALALVAWGVWNLAADAHFKNVLGPTYDRAIPAVIPR
jgi:predicted metal-binding protein